MVGRGNQYLTPPFCYYTRKNGQKDEICFYRFQKAVDRLAVL
jgi:hypothetical protein